MNPTIRLSFHHSRQTPSWRITYSHLPSSLPSASNEVSSTSPDLPVCPPFCGSPFPPFLHIILISNLVVELGSGTALPSLLASTLTTPPALVVVTDYPDDVIINNLQNNVDRNLGFISPHCTVECQGYEWGKDPSHLLYASPPHCPPFLRHPVL
jgi:hypothetical protein